MRNLTLAIEEDLLTRARKIAVEKGTTVNQMVRELLNGLVHENDPRAEALERLRQRMSERPLAVGERSWTREELHER